MRDVQSNDVGERGQLELRAVCAANTEVAE